MPFILEELYCIGVMKTLRHASCFSWDRVWLLAIRKLDMKASLHLLGGFTVVALVTFFSPAWAQGGPGGGPGGPPPMMVSAEEMDTNHDGSVSFEEFSSARDKMHKEMFKRMDSDSNGTLSKEEMSKRPGPGGPGGGPGGGQDSAPPMPPPDRAGGNSGNGPGASGDGPPRPPSIEDMDANHDGSVSEAEFTAAAHKRDRTEFDRLDANGDGVLSKDELAKAKGPGQRGQGPGPGGQR